MPYGIEIYNSSGETQVDGTYKNFSLHDSGVWSPSGLESESVSFASTSVPPIIAARPDTDNYCNLTNYETDSNGNYNAAIGYSSGSIDVPFIVLTETGTNEINGPYGLAIYDSSGELVFHNFNKWCRLVSYQTVSKGSNAGVVSVNNNYFILRPCCFGQDYYSFYDATMKITIGMKKVDSTTINIDMFEFDYGDPDTGSYDFCPGSFKLIEIAT